MLVVGVALLCYPTVSNLYNQIGASYAVRGYEDHTKALSDEERRGMLAAARSYNADLAGREQVFLAGEPVDERYRLLLDAQGDSMIGFLTIDKIDLQVPIYHGTSDEVLAKSIGHLEGSSLPVGGAGSHVVVSGHRGLPSARLFTDLDRLKEGDTFVLTVLGRKMTYEVDKITVIKPDEMDELRVVPGKDLVTLLTCTPYAVNTHRLLVRGTRVPNGPEPVDGLSGPAVNPLAVVFAALAVLVSLGAVLSFALYLHRGRRKDTAKHIRRA